MVSPLERLVHDILREGGILFFLSSGSECSSPEEAVSELGKALPVPVYLTVLRGSRGVFYAVSGTPSSPVLSPASFRDLDISAMVRKGIASITVMEGVLRIHSPAPELGSFLSGFLSVSGASQVFHGYDPLGRASDILLSGVSPLVSVLHSGGELGIYRKYARGLMQTDLLFLSSGALCHLHAEAVRGV